MAEMPLAKDHHVIEAIPPDRSDQPPKSGDPVCPSL
jgi:hypothetical protein